MKYGAVPMSPLIFQDDLLECSPGIIEARSANIRINKVMIEKRQAEINRLQAKSNPVSFYDLLMNRDVLYLMIS